MACTEAYKEHIMYSFNAFCKVVIRYAAINAWRRGKSFTFTFSGITHSRKSRIYTGIARLRHGIICQDYKYGGQRKE